MTVSKLARLVFMSLVCLGPTLAASAQSSQRPIQDWVAPNVSAPGILWFDAGAPQPSPRIYFDFFGSSNTLCGLNLGTQFDGTITETPLANGRARVLVLLQSSNVLTYATVSGSEIFGHFPYQVAGGADAALGTTRLAVDFENRAPGAPLPSLNALSFDTLNPNFKLGKVGLVADAEGTLREAFGIPEGTPGTAHTAQRGLYNVPGLQLEGHDLFPAEKVEIQPGH